RVRAGPSVAGECLPRLVNETAGPASKRGNRGLVAGGVGVRVATFAAIDGLQPVRMFRVVAGIGEHVKQGEHGHVVQPRWGLVVSWEPLVPEPAAEGARADRAGVVGGIIRRVMQRRRRDDDEEHAGISGEDLLERAVSVAIPGVGLTWSGRV